MLMVMEGESQVVDCRISPRWRSERVGVHPSTRRFSSSTLFGWPGAQTYSSGG